MLITVGEPLLAFVANDVGPLDTATGYTRHVTGAELNVAVGAARLGCQTATIGRVGDDAFGSAVLRQLRAESVDCSYVRRTPGRPTGALFRNLSALGPSEVLYYRHGSAGSTLSAHDIDAASELFDAADAILVSGATTAVSESARQAVSRAVEIAVDKEVAIALDINYRARLISRSELRMALAPLLPAVKWLLGDIDELALADGADLPPIAPADVTERAELSTREAELVRRLQETGVEEVVIKRGASGAIWIRPDMTMLTAAPPTVARALDPVGAGDAFAAGLLAGLLSGQDEAAALGQAVICGACAVTGVGDLTTLPDRAQLARWADGDTSR